MPKLSLVIPFNYQDQVRPVFAAVAAAPARRYREIIPFNDASIKPCLSAIGFKVLPEILIAFRPGRNYSTYKIQTRRLNQA